MPETIIRMFGFTGFRVPQGAVPVLNVNYLDWPPSTRETITLDGGAAQSTAHALTPQGVGLVLVQVEEGKRAHLELSANADSLRDADHTSPVIRGDLIIQVGAGWVLSLMACED